MLDLLILRHGETTWNREGRLQGGRDAPLTPRGRVQAARQGAALRRIGGTRPVLCSPQGRARATAALAGLHPRIARDLHEITLGDWEGRTLAEIAPPPGLDWKFDAPGGEGRAAFLRRIDAILAACPPRAILVTHGVVASGLRGRLAGWPPEEWHRVNDLQGVVYHVTRDGERMLP
ncbi:MAG: histidine phosphatase family protein [Pseudomonadota bacterium]